MDLDLTETQQQLRELAAEVFGKQVSPARVERVQTEPDRFDRDLWRQLGVTGLLGVVAPEEHGGLGLGFVELVLVAAEFGRVVASAPFAAASVAAAFLSTYADDAHRAKWLPGVAAGSALLIAAPPLSTSAVRADGNRLTGSAVGVPWAHVAERLLVVADDAAFLLDPSDAAVTATRGETTAREIALDLVLHGAPAERIGPASSYKQIWALTLSGVQAGVTDAALRLTADYTSTRHQFGKPLATFQGVALRAADAYVDATSIWRTTLQAAWKLDQGEDATLDVLTAAWWAADAGQRAVHATQHLHGGIGADITYPVHRYFLWGKQIELMLGGASAVLAELGEELAVHPDAGDALG